MSEEDTIDAWVNKQREEDAIVFDVCLETYIKEVKPTREQLLDLIVRNADDWRKIKEISKYLKEEENE